MKVSLKAQMISNSPKATERIGSEIGNRLRGGEVVELISDLGGGKTTFVHGLARGLGSDDAVASPTFTISREYKAGHLILHHFDFYRLNEPGIVAEELAEIIGDPDNVTVVEWGQLVEDVLPPDRIIVRFKSRGENSRQLAFIYPEKLAYVIPKTVKL